MIKKHEMVKLKEPKIHLETKKFIDEIEEEYFPRNINVENIK